MNITEKNLETIIFRASENDEYREQLRNRGLPVRGKMYRQLSLGAYGRLDLMTISSYKTPWSNTYTPVITIYELKQGNVGFNAMGQAFRYLTAVKSIWSHKFNTDEPIFNAVLIGKDVEMSGDFLLTYNFISNLEIYTFDYRIDGIWFEHLGKNFVRTEEKINFDNYNITFGDAKMMLNKK